MIEPTPLKQILKPPVLVRGELMRLIIWFCILSLCLPQPIFAGSMLSKTRAVVETGAQAGYAFGVEGPTHSTFRAVTEIGVMFDRMKDKSKPKKAFGITLYSAMGDDDFRIGLKPRLRYQLHPKWSTDLSAGLIFASLEGHPSVSTTGLVGGIALNYGSWLTLKTDVNIVSVDDRPKYQQGEQVGVIKGGREISVYGGVSLRNRAGVYATVVGAALFLAFAIIYMAETGGT
jgi:hypothetical protein